MYKNCNTEESAQRQQQLEECLLKNMLAKPYAEISVSDLCQQAGISRKSFYRYFGSKDGCLNALLDRVLLESTKYRYEESISHHTYAPELIHSLTYWKQQKALLDSLIANGLLEKLLERTFLHTVREERGFLRLLGVVDVNRDKDRLLFVVTGFITLIVNWNRSGYQKSLTEMTSTLTQLLTRPLLTLPAVDE